MKILVLISTFAIAAAFGPGSMMGPPKSAPAMPDNLDDFSEEDLYHCWFYMNCLQFGKEEHPRIEKCFDHLDESDSRLIYSWYEGAQSDYPTLYDGLWDLVCKTPRDKRIEQFQIVAVGSFELPSVGCEQRYDEETCEHFRVMMECTTELFATLKKEGKCETGKFPDEN